MFFCLQARALDSHSSFFISHRVQLHEAVLGDYLLPALDGPRGCTVLSLLD